MLDAAKRDLEEMRQLALLPTVANFDAINSKLEHLANLLSGVATDQDPRRLKRPELKAFLKQLPVEMARLSQLMAAPANFYESLACIRALHFCSYERTGAVRSLEPQSSPRTVLHL